MLRFTLFILALVFLTGCGGRFATTYDTAMSPTVTRAWTVVDVQVDVPAALTVSDANVMAPRADIVWHGDPEGDRKAQVAAMVTEGIRQGSATLEGPQRVILGATLQEFHAVTPRAVNSAPSAVHNISYTLQAFDAATAVPISPAVLIQADLEALTRAGAIVAAQEGRTQKARITSHLARVTEGWLGIGPDQRRRFTSLGR